MTTATDDSQLERICRSHEDARSDKEFARSFKVNMLAKDDMWHWPLSIEAAINHCLSFGNAFLVWLEQAYQRASQISLSVHHELCNGYERSHVHVMTTCVHHRHLPARSILLDSFVSIRKIGFFLDSKCIHISTE